MKSKLLLTLLLTMTTMLKAEISKDLQGSWILDKAETRKELKKNKVSDKSIEQAILRFENFSQAVTKDEVKILMDQEPVISFKFIKESKKEGLKTITVSTKRKEHHIDLTFIPKANGSYIIKSSDTNDMDHYVWKKKQ